MEVLTSNVERAAFVRRILPEAASFDPHPVLVPEIFPQYHRNLHLSCKGKHPAINIYEFQGCSVGPHGAIISRDKELLGPPDIIGSKWIQTRLEEAIKLWSEDDSLIRALSGKAEVQRHEDNEPVFVLNRPGGFVYGHWLLDILPMLFVFFHFRKLNESLSLETDVDTSKVHFLLPHGTPAWAIDILSLLFDIDIGRLIFYREHVSVFSAPRLLVASQMRYSDFCSPSMSRYIDFIKARILPYASGQVFPERIFVTRKGVESPVPRAVHNENALINLAKRFDVVDVDPTKWSWPDQVRLFSEAKLICGPFGSGLHNSIFGSNDATCLSLGSSRMNWIQSGLSALRQQRMSYLLPVYEDFRDGRNLMVYDTERFSYGLEASIARQTSVLSGLTEPEGSNYAK